MQKLLKYFFYLCIGAVCLFNRVLFPLSSHVLFLSSGSLTGEYVFFHTKGMHFLSKGENTLLGQVF
jgi:hypothetical protein